MWADARNLFICGSEPEVVTCVCELRLRYACFGTHVFGSWLVDLQNSPF